MSSNSKFRSHTEPDKESRTIGDSRLSETENLRRANRYVEDVDDDTAEGLHTDQKPSSDSPSKELPKRSVIDRIKEFKDNYHFPTATSSIQTSCDEFDAPGCDAKVNNNMTPSAFETHPSSLSTSTANLPMTQITNNGGTININYNLHPAPGPRLNKGMETTADKNEENVQVKPDRDLTSPFGISAETFVPKSVSESHTRPGDAVMGHTVQQTHDEILEIDVKYNFSDIEKAKLKDSIDVMIKDCSSRTDLSKKLMEFAQTIDTVTCYEAECTYYVQMEMDTDSSSADSDRQGSVGCEEGSSRHCESMRWIFPTTGEIVSGPKYFHTTPISTGNELFMNGHSDLGINVPSTCEPKLSSQGGVNEDDSNKSDARNVNSSVSTRKDGSTSPSATTQSKNERWDIVKRIDTDLSTEHSGGFPNVGTEEPPSKHQVQTDNHMPPDLASCSTRANQDAKRGPKVDAIPAPAVVTSAASPRKTKKKARRAPTSRSIQDQGENKETPENEAVPEHKDVLAHPQGSPPKGVGKQANQELNTEVTNNHTPRIGHPTPACCQPDLPAISKTAPAVSPNKDFGQKMGKRRSKKPTIEADQCEGSSGGPANNSANDPAARRAMVLGMLARMAGGPNSSADGAQGSGHRDFTFLLPPPAENRKCRLCRNMFTDKSNVKQADGGAPCSFHPGKYPPSQVKSVFFPQGCC